MFAAVSVCLLWGLPAWGLVLHTDDVPTDKPYDEVVGRWRTNASAVAIGPNHILTTRHQWGDTGDSVYFSNGVEMVEYIVGEIRWTNDDGLEKADIRIAQIWTTDGKPANLQWWVRPYGYGDEVGKEIVLGGFGKRRGTELKTPGGTTYGYTWDGTNNQTQTWGANTVHSTEDNVLKSIFTSDTILLDFDDAEAPGSVDCEAAGAEYDSGGGWFIFDDVDQEWKVAALTAYADQEHATGQSWFRDPITGKRRPDMNWGIRVSAYKDWVEDHSATFEVPPGDANLDGFVNVGDLGILAANYGTTSGMTWTDGDFNSNGGVEVGDLGIMAANYDGGAGANSGAIPEPTSLLLFSCGLAILLRRRR